MKNRFNVSYDYAFVSGELRIARVVNVNKRKLVARIQSDDIIQLGDVENTAFDGLRAVVDAAIDQSDSYYDSL